MISLGKGFFRVFSVITIVLGSLIALFLLLFGVANLINPDVPDDYLGQNSRVCLMFILNSLVIVYAIFRPFSGGIFLSICSLICFVIVIVNPVIVPVLLVGILSIIRGRLSRHEVLKAPDQTL